MKWEYKNQLCAGKDEIDNTLRTYGEDGWECFAVMPGKSTQITTIAIRLFFKRPIAVEFTGTIRNCWPGEERYYGGEEPQIGDALWCIDDAGTTGITQGVSYTVTDIAGHHIYFGPSVGYLPRRFKLTSRSGIAAYKNGGKPQIGDVVVCADDCDGCQEGHTYCVTKLQAGNIRFDNGAFGNQNGYDPIHFEKVATAIIPEIP